MVENADYIEDQGNYTELITKYSDEVKRLKDKYKDKNPKHWTIADEGK